jgi:hypothetical protein
MCSHAVAGAACVRPRDLSADGTLESLLHSRFSLLLSTKMWAESVAFSGTAMM